MSTIFLFHLTLVLHVKVIETNASHILQSAMVFCFVFFFFFLFYFCVRRTVAVDAPAYANFQKKEAGTKKIPIAVFSVYLLVYYFLCKCLHVMLSCCRRCCRCILLLRRIKYVYILSIYAVCVYRDASFFHKYI